MRNGRAIKRRYLIAIPGLVCSAVLITAFLIGAFHPQNTRAADVSSSYNWKPLKIGGGGWVTGIVAQPTTRGLVYARTDVGGAYRWDEGSQSWTQLITTDSVPNAGGADYNIESIAVSKTNNQIVYIAAGGTGDFTNDAPAGRILKSTNQGRTWSDPSGQRWKIGGNADNRQTSERLAVDPNNENIVYFGSRNMGLWRTTDGGQHWNQITQVPTLFTNGDNNPAGDKFVVFDPTSSVVNGYTQRIYVGVSGGGVYTSSNGGNDWSNLYPTDQVTVAGGVSGNGTAYFSIGNGHLQRYTPSSNNWKDVTPPGGGNYFTVTIDPYNAQRLIIGPSPVQHNRIWRTNNSGDSWDTLDFTIASPDIPWITNTDEDQWMSTGNIIFDPQVPDQLWFAEGTGVFRANGLTGTSLTLNFINKGIEEFIGTDLVAPPGGQPVSTVWDRQGFYHANVDGFPQKTLINQKFESGWSLDYSGQNPQFLVSVISDNRYLSPDFSGYSNDGGKNWNTFANPGTINDRFAGNIAVSATNTRNIIWLPTYGRDPYVSTDQGASWNKQSFFDNVGGLHIQWYHDQRRGLESDKVDGSFYVYSTNGLFYRSTNSGQNWEQAPGTAPTSGGGDAWVLSQMHAAPGLAGNVWVSNGLGGLSYTQNKGNSWTKVSTVQQSRAFGFGKTLPGASYPTIFMNGMINNQWGIYRSSDKGATWDLLSTHPMGLAGDLKVVTGDMNIAGRVYVAVGGTGFVYGDGGTGNGGGGNGGSVANGRYSILNHNSNKAMDDAGGGGAGTQLIQWTNYSNANQKWDVSSVGNGYYKITSAGNGLAIDVSGGSTAQEAAIVLQPYTGSDSQLWSFTATSGGYYKIINKHSGDTIGVTGGWLDDGTKLIQWPANGSADQEWNFQPTS